MTALPTQPTSASTLAGGSSGGKARLLWGAVVAAVVVTGFIAILAVDSRWFYVNDTESGAIGNWLQLGRIMREGNLFPSLVLDQWMAGNYPVEGQGGLFNPVQMAINYASPSIDNLNFLAIAVKLGFSLILATGVYRVAMTYGARPAWAAVAGASAPFVGFTLFFEQPAWITSLMGAAWVMQAWASGVRYARGYSGPVSTFVFLYLAISIGYVHAALMAGVVVACIAVGEYVDVRRWRPVLRILAVGIAAAGCGAITFLPGILTASVTYRSGSEGVTNDNFLTAPWSETLTSIIPSSISSIEGYSGETTYAPITYIGWFVLPILAFVAWRAVPGVLRQLSTPIVLLIVLLLFTAGPSAIGPLRYPARLLPFVALISLILVSVLISRFGTVRMVRPRLIAAAVIVVVMVLRAASSGPQFTNRHLVAGLLIISVGAIGVYLARRFGQRAVAVLVLITIVPVATYQVAAYSAPFAKWWLPTSQAQAKAEFPQWEGVTLQFGQLNLTGQLSATNEHDPSLPWHSQVYGNYAKVLDSDYVNAYTPVGYEKFGDLLCFEFEGSTCRDSFTNAFRIEPYTGRTYVDLMGVDRVVLQQALYPRADLRPPPDGWQWVDPPTTTAGQIYVLERTDGPVSDVQGRIVATVDAMARSEGFSATSERARVTSAEGGSVVFSRLAWPGYTATLNGETLQTKGLADIFLYVDLPPGTENADLELTFRPPGERLGLAAMAGGVMVLIGLVVLDVRRRRNVRSSEFGTAPQSS
ncbi:Hypothetical membrane protein [Rhodococcus sp. AW25M09]|uniref:membrane protein n=1 Tax=Rhodococcus sp. AW25M09 TaxID=1268303 RepID=UPI0002ABD220|nr:membrane protein [Rhodococcus sp. AW25M09]CCQ14424.1 Hypothetical membrane protein [Rhodococcus sp. AW25M09]